MKKFVTLSAVLAISWLSCTSQPWIKADNLRKKYLNEFRYDSALYYTEEAAALMRGTSGENNIRYCDMLNNLAVSHFYLGNYKKAKYYILKEAVLRETLKADDDIIYLNCLEDASVICRKAGSYDDGLTQIKKAERMSARINGSSSPAYANTLVCYAGVCHDWGCSVNDMVYLKEEEVYLKRAEAIYSKNWEKSKYEAMINKSDQAVLNNNIGNSPVAESLLQEVVAFCRNEFGESATGYASAINNLAVLYYNTGEYKQSEKYFVEAVDIYLKSSEAGRIQTAVCINNLGALYNEMGNFPVAEKLFARARDIMVKDHQQNNPLYAVILNNMAAIAITVEYFASPENKSSEKLINSGKTLFKADSVFRLNCQKPHPFNLSITNNLGIWYNLNGDKKKSSQILYDMALEGGMSLRVVALMNKMSTSDYLSSQRGGNTAPEPVIIPINVKLLDQVSASNMEINGPIETDGFTNALLRMIMGKATNIKKAVGPYHPAYANMLKTLIVSYNAFEDVKTEEELTLEYMDVINHKTLQDFSFLSDNEKELYYQTRLPDVNSFIAYSLERKNKNPSIAGYAYNNILLNKGLMLKSSTAMRLAILNSNNAELLKMYDEWIALQKEISLLYSTPVELRTKDVTSLESKANTLEKLLVTNSQDFSDYRKGTQISWEDVKKSLNPDEAAIEFTEFKKREKDGGDAVIYCALILRPNSVYPAMVKLFTEDQLTAIIGKNGGNDISYINDIYGNSKRQDQRLYDLIWKPVEEYLNGVKKVIISPSGLLFKISFPSISKEKDVYLCDRYQIQVKGSTGNNAGQSLFSAGNNTSALVFGGIKYSQSSSGNDVWKYLEGTKNEGDSVNTILKKGKVDVVYLSDNMATETYFKQNAQKFNVLHIATHGFSFADPNEVRFEEKKSEVEYGDVTFRGAGRGFGVNSFVNSENPLMRSGLVMAGANEVWVKTEKGETDDGVLTAQEVTQIDMRKNDLVVLSACETGLGDIKGNEGVYGLQRALKMAGVKYIIISLWEIPDKETVEFMGTFYNNLLKLKDIRSAFSGAQNVMRKKYDPYYWGAFVLME